MTRERIYFDRRRDRREKRPVGESRIARIVGKKKRKNVISVGIGYSFLSDTSVSAIQEFRYSRERGRLEKFLTRRDFWDDTRSTACRRGWNERASHNATRSYR